MIKLCRIFGIPQIDAEHLEILNILNDIIDLIKKSANKAIVSEKTGYLKHKFITHYQTENRLMRQTRYPQATMHDAQHNEFLAFLEKKIRQGGSHGKSSDLDRYDLQYATAWFANHLSTHDKVFCNFLKTTGLEAFELSKAANDYINKRKHTRIYLKVDGILRIANGQTLQGTIGNISFSGMDFQCPSPPYTAIGETCRLEIFPEFHQKKQTIGFECHMIRMNSRGVALKFVTMDTDAFQWFEMFMRYHYVKPEVLLREARDHQPIMILTQGTSRPDDNF